ncbi:MAG: hypothetical protein ABR915_21000 [Thermoguttaceae bacterium]
MAALFVLHITKWAIFAHYRAKGQAIIVHMEERRPNNVTPRAWETATTWAGIAYGNVCCSPEHVSIAEMKRLAEDFEAHSQNNVDLSTVTWIWERLAATGPVGQGYHAKFWPQYRQNLAYAQASDESLPLLEGFGECQYLDLRGTPVTDAGLAHLKKATKLESLSLSDGITDAGMVYLSELTNLRWLSLMDTKVSDIGLEQLKGLSHLQGLYLKGSKVTDDGVKKLQQALPNCKIER